ncbi:hypothetical protein QCF19_14390, partial [Staphylococcus aureus]|nr:hypothetical protein [Staphylococcus aureus]
TTIRIANFAALALMTALAWAPAQARLPAPNAEQQRAADERKAKEAEVAKQQADALARVQDQIATRFGKGAQPSGTTPHSEIPQKAAEVRPSGPHGGTAPGAEAHSGQAQRR